MVWYVLSNRANIRSSPTLVKLKSESIREYSSTVRQKDKQIISWRILATTEQLKWNKNLDAQVEDKFEYK